MTKQQADAIKGLYDNAGMSQDVCIAARGGKDGTEYGVSQCRQTGQPCEWDYMTGIAAFCAAYKAAQAAAFFGGPTPPNNPITSEDIREHYARVACPMTL